MASVTNVMVSFDSLESEEAFDAAVNSWLGGLPTHPMDIRDGGGWSLGCLTSFEAVDVGWGGSKQPTVSIFAGALNHFELHQVALMEWLRAYPWEHPECVQVFIFGAEDARFAVSVLDTDRAWQQVCDGG